MKNYILIFSLFIATIAAAQDTIIKKNGDIIRAKVTEIGTDEVKFKIFGQQDGAVITIMRSDIKKAIVGGQTIINVKAEGAATGEDVIVKKSGDIIKIKVLEIGTDEVKFKLFNDPDGPTISMLKSEIKTMKVQGQTVIDVKTGLTEDVITKMDGTVIKAKISEMGAEEVKYKLYSNPDGPVMSLKKREIESVKIDGQTVYEHKDDPLSVSNNVILDRTSTLKFYFFSPLNQHIAFGYEWMNKPGFNWDVALGIIGPGVTKGNNRQPSGVFLRGGPKFLLGSSSDVVTEDTKDRYAHPLRGKYFKLDFILNAFSTTTYLDTLNPYNLNNNNTGFAYKKKYQSVTIDLQYGKQYILGNTATLAWYFGAGYSFESESSTLDPKYKDYDFFDLARYSHTYFGRRYPLVFTWGLTIGFIMPAPKGMISKKVLRVKPPSRNSMSDK